MIAGIGHDIVEVVRFQSWHSYPKKSLQRIFSSPEIDYCLSSEKLSAERFAARFAAREAAYKAFCLIFDEQKISFLRFCKTIAIELSKNGAPKLTIDWISLNMPDLKGTILLTLSHTKTIASAIVIFEKNQ